jgi:hypothetical protein
LARAPKAFAIFCEEVRTEAGGKHTLLGAFAGDLHISSFPAQIRLAIYGVVSFDEVGHHKLQWRLMLGKEVAASAEAEADVKPGFANIVVVPMGLLQVEKPSELRFEMSIDGGRFTDLVAAKLFLPPDAPTSPTAPSQPSGQSPPARKRIRRML